MNVLCSTLFAGDIEVVSRLRKKYNITSLYVLQSHEWGDLENSNLMEIVKERYTVRNFEKTNYDKYIFYDEMPPLDQEILDKMSLYEPEALKLIEREERLGDSAEKRMIHYHQHLRYWNYFLDRAKIDLFISWITPHGIREYLAMRLCKLKKIPVLQFERLPFQTTSRVFLFREFEQFDSQISDRIKMYQDSFQTAEDVELTEDMKKEYDTFQKTDKQIVPVSDTMNVSRMDWLKARSSAFKVLWGQNRHHAFNMAKTRFKQQKDTKKLLRMYEDMAVQPDFSIPYIYFPLHYQPELTTCPLGGWYVHQYLAIEMLSYYVPKGVQIYVKEHPVMKELPLHSRNEIHYQLMNKLKNVKLISLNINTIPLIEHAAAIASITGSVGYESMYKKKPYFMFGNQVMRYAPGTFNIRNRSDCELAIKAVFEEKFIYGEKDIKCFLKAISEFSTIARRASKDRGWDLNPDNINVITKMYEDEIDKIIGE